MGASPEPTGRGAARRLVRLVVVAAAAIAAVALVRRWRFAVNERRDPPRPPSER